jgi:DNA-binding CsgD family transcriptional regulator
MSIDKGHKGTGLFFAAIFLVGALVSAWMGVYLRGKPVLEAALHPNVLICLLVCALMVLSARFAKLAFLQPVVWFLCSLISMQSGQIEIRGVGFFVVGVLLLFRFGFYEKRRGPKIAVTLGLFYAADIAVAVLAKRPPLENLGGIFVITMLLLTLYLAYHEKLMVYLKEPKPQLSLTEKGLSDAEKTYVLAVNKGLSPKEVAFEYEVSESTIRNTLARAYKKLEVTDRSGLAALAERYDIHE